MASDKNQKLPQKAVLSFGYQKFILNVEDAVALFTHLRSVEVLGSKWDKDVNVFRYFVKPVEDDTITLSYLSPEMYATGKFNTAAEQNKSTDQ